MCIRDRFKNNELKEAIEKAEKRKIFLGFSDTTMNHLMLHKLGFGTFYGQSFLADVCEMEDDMLPYTKKFFEELIKTGNIKEIVPSDVDVYKRQGHKCLYFCKGYKE